MIKLLAFHNVIQVSFFISICFKIFTIILMKMAFVESAKKQEGIWFIFNLLLTKLKFRLYVINAKMQLHVKFVQQTHK